MAGRYRIQNERRLDVDAEMTSSSNDAASVAELRRQLAEAQLSAEQTRLAADQLKLDNNRSVYCCPMVEVVS